MHIIKQITLGLGLWTLRGQSAAIPARHEYKCDGVVPVADAALAKNYVCGDQRLGPVDIHGSKIIHTMTRAYCRLGRLRPSSFLKKWTKPDGRFLYPAEDGFVLDRNQKAVKQAAILCPGTVVDRFGGEASAFLAPGGMPYGSRSIPPQNLVTRAEPNSTPYNYHAYVVLKELSVMAGCIAPWFEQPGLGVQYLMNMTVSLAIETGLLARIELKEDTVPANKHQLGSGCKPTVLKCPGYSIEDF